MFAIKFNGGDFRSETLKGIKDYAREQGFDVVTNEQMRVPQPDEGYESVVEFVYKCDSYHVVGTEFVCTHSSSLRVVAVTEEILVNGRYEVIDSPFSLSIRTKVAL